MKLFRVNCITYGENISHSATVHIAEASNFGSCEQNLYLTYSKSTIKHYMNGMIVLIVMITEKISVQG